MIDQPDVEMVRTALADQNDKEIPVGTIELALDYAEGKVESELEGESNVSLVDRRAAILDWAVLRTFNRTPPEVRSDLGEIRDEVNVETFQEQLRKNKEESLDELKGRDTATVETWPK